jgi:hypothetical protein
MQIKATITLMFEYVYAIIATPASETSTNSIVKNFSKKYSDVVF